MSKDFQTFDLRVILTNIKNTSKVSINEYADNGSPCPAPLSNLKYFVVFPPLMCKIPDFFKSF